MEKEALESIMKYSKNVNEILLQSKFVIVNPAIIVNLTYNELFLFLQFILYKIIFVIVNFLIKSQYLIINLIKI